MSRDIYAEVTNALVATIEANPGDPMMPWHRGGASEVPRNIASEQEYQGVNILNLWVRGQIAGYSSNIWGTFNQWRKLGAQVRKGEKSTPVIFYKQVRKEGADGEEETYRVLKSFPAFNADQVDGWDAPQPRQADVFERLEDVEHAVSATGAIIREGGDRAFYSPATDIVHMPNRSLFFGTSSGTREENFYAVLWHELAHWTGHPSRCDRDLRNRFGSEAYAMEELVAELGAAFCCARLGISPAPREDHAQYLANWLKVLKSDKKAIFTAAAKAQAAVDYLL